MRKRYKDSKNPFHKYFVKQEFKFSDREKLDLDSINEQLISHETSENINPLSQIIIEEDGSSVEQASIRPDYSKFEVSKQTQQSYLNKVES